jgi:hypothetical protein
MGRGGCDVSKKAPLIDTSREPVDAIDKFNVSPPADNGKCRRSPTVELTSIAYKLRRALAKY